MVTNIGSPSAPTERWEAETVELPASLESETQPQKQGRPSLSKVGGASFVLGAHPLVQEELLVGPRVLEELEMGRAGVEVGGHSPGT